jgi:hypothetical protein
MRQFFNTNSAFWPSTRPRGCRFLKRIYNIKYPESMINCRYYEEIYYSLHDFETLPSMD